MRLCPPVFAPRRATSIPATGAAPRGARGVAVGVTLGVMLGVVACAPPMPRAPGPSVPEASTTVAADSLRPPWRITRDGASRAYRVVLRAELQSRIDSVIRVDTLESSSTLSWSASVDERQAQVFGRVHAFALRSGSDTTWRSLPALGFPVVFTAATDDPTRQPLLRDPAGDGCDARSAVVAAWRETWVPLPARLVPQQRWQDSTDLPLCRDGIVLQTRVIRTFVADSLALRDGQRVVHLRRSVASTLQGVGVQFGDSVRLEGTGTGTARLVVALAGGHLLAAEGRTELRLQLRGRRRTQQLVQLGALSITSP